MGISTNVEKPSSVTFGFFRFLHHARVAGELRYVPYFLWEAHGSPACLSPAAWRRLWLTSGKSHLQFTRRARGAARSGEVGEDDEDEADKLRVVGGGTAARDEAGAALVAPAPPRPTSASAG